MRFRLISFSRNMGVCSCSCRNETDWGKRFETDWGKKFKKGFAFEPGGGSTGVQNSQYLAGKGPATPRCGTMQEKAKTKTSNRHSRDRIRRDSSPKKIIVARSPLHSLASASPEDTPMTLGA